MKTFHQARTVGINCSSSFCLTFLTRNRLILGIIIKIQIVIDIIMLWFVNSCKSKLFELLLNHDIIGFREQRLHDGHPF